MEDDLLEDDIEDKSDDLDDLEEISSLEEIVPDEILERLPEELQRRLRAAFRYMRVEAFAGPLPHPRLIRQYEDAVPGSGNRIIAMAESQQQHRHSIETAVINSDIVMERSGLLAATFLSTVILVGSFILLAIGKEAFGIALIITNITAILGAFGFAQRQRAQERRAQRRRLRRETQRPTEPLEEDGLDEEVEQDRPNSEAQ